MARGELQRRGARPRQQRPVVLIVTEGAQTEPNYFNSFRTRHNNIDIHVVGGGSGQGTDYASLVKKAVDYMQKNGLSAKNGDSLWIVADADINYNVPDPIAVKNRLLESSKRTANRHGIQIALSNPCFEVWFLLHFRYSSAQLRDYPAVLTQLKAYLPDYVKTANVNDHLRTHIETAMRNAERLAAYHKENQVADLCNISVNPYTAVYELVSKVLHN